MANALRQRKKSLIRSLFDGNVPDRKFRATARRVGSYFWNRMFEYGAHAAALAPSTCLDNHLKK
jgi:hypothetical protein